MKKRILFILPYPVNKAPSQRLKFEQYFKAIEEAGYEIETSSFINEPFWKIVYKKGHLFSKITHTLLGYFRRIRDLFRLRKFDLVYIHLWFTPFGFPISEWIFSKLARKVIYDIDDLIYLGTDIGKNKLVHGLKGRLKPAFLIKNSDHVIVCTPKLEEYAAQFNSSVTDISSTINTESYQPVNTYQATENLTLGWSGSHSTSKYLYLLEPVLRALQKKRPFKLLVLGDDKFDIEGIDVEALPWTEEMEIPNLQRIDIGLYPLPDEPWVYGKSGLKALQYMALGIPTVATAIGANFRIIENKENGILVSSQEEWVDAIVRLMDNPELRKEIGIKARERVVSEYSVAANTETYLKIIRKVLN